MATAPLPPSTPSRRANVPTHIKEWIYKKALQFEYYDANNKRGKEEKQAFIAALTKRLNERHPETGAWDDVRTGAQVRNLRKERSGKENLLQLPPSVAPPPVAALPLRPVQKLLRDWQATLLAASALNSATLARHSANRGSCNEELVRGFLGSVLGSRLIGVGCGEVLESSDGGVAAPRQVDVLLYNTDYPCLMPARIGGSSASPCACFYPESVLAVIEVKTTLTNQDLRDVCTAAGQLAPLPFFIVAFDSQSTLRAVDCSNMPENVIGIYALSHGSLVRSDEECRWQTVFPSQRPPLEVFYAGLLDAISCQPSLNALACSLRRHLHGNEKNDDTAQVENVLSELNINVNSGDDT